MTNEMYESYKRNANIFGRLIDEMGRQHQAQTKSGWFNEPVNHGLAARGIKVRGRRGRR